MVGQVSCLPGRECPEFLSSYPLYSFRVMLSLPSSSPFGKADRIRCTPAARKTPTRSGLGFPRPTVKPILSCLVHFSVNSIYSQGSSISFRVHRSLISCHNRTTGNTLRPCLRAHEPRVRHTGCHVNAGCLHPTENPARLLLSDLIGYTHGSPRKKCCKAAIV
jgi:hypothetical protein